MVPNIEETFNFLGLPRELRDSIYDLITTQEGTTYNGALLWSNALTVKRGHHTTPFPHTNHDLPAYALLFLNHQISNEFKDALARNVPHHIRTTHIRVNEIGKEPALFFSFAATLQLDLQQCLHTLLPSPARHLCLEIYTRADPESGWRAVTEEFETHVMSADAFKQIAHLLTTCTNTTYMSIKWKFTRDCGFPMPYDLEYLYCPMLVLERLVQIIEAMPDVLKYQVQVDHRMMYASRDATDSWDSSHCVHLIDPHVPMSDKEWEQFYYKMKLGYRIASRYVYSH